MRWAHARAERSVSVRGVVASGASNPTGTAQLFLQGHHKLFVLSAIGDALQNCVVEVVGGVTA